MHKTWPDRSTPPRSLFLPWGGASTRHAPRSTQQQPKGFSMITTRQFALGTLAASVMLASHAGAADFTDNEIRIGYLADMSGVYRDPIGPLGLDAIQMAVRSEERRVGKECRSRRWPAR